MINKLKKIYYDYGFEILIGLSIIFIIILSIYSYTRGKNGTYSSTYFYDKNIEDSKNKGKFLDILDNFSFKSKNSTPDSQSTKKDSIGEIECRRVLQRIFKRPFSKARPDFLRNPVTGGNFNLEIDCYCPELKLGLEYNGRQHYEYIPYFHRNKETFYNQQYRDYMKKNMCLQNGINLIEVPYSIKKEHIENFIIKKLRELKYI